MKAEVRRLVVMMGWGATAMLAMVLVNVVWVRPAAAAGCPSAVIEVGRGSFCGYFYDNYYNSGHDVFTGPAPGYNQDPSTVGQNGVPNSVADGAGLVNWMKGRLNENCSVVPVNPCHENITGAQFTILTMLGAPAGTAKGQAAARFNEWSKDVVAADDAKMVTWDALRWFPCSKHNSLYQGPPPPLGGPYEDVAPYIQPAGSPDCDRWIHEIIFYTSPSKTTVAYEIKRDCGNPIGAMNAIPRLNYTLVPSGWETPSYQVSRGDVATIHVQLHNNGPSYTQSGTVQVHPVIGGAAVGPGGGSISGASAIAGQVSQPCVPTCVGPGQTALRIGGTTYSTGDGYRTAALPGLNGPDWYWTFAPIPNGGTATSVFNFTVSNTAAVGFVTFNVCVAPANQSNATTCNHVTVQIVSKRYPSVVGLNSDVNAGGAVGLKCPTGTPAGNALGNVNNSASYGQYAVSASGVISDFGSNNTLTAPATNQLKIGTGGAYECIPRPDLMVAADNYRTAGVGYGTIASSSVDVSSLTTYPVYYFDGGDLYIHGVIMNKLTIVAKNGNVHIDGPLTIDTAHYSARPDPVTGGGAPSLGVIAGQDIDISNATNTVDGFLFAYGAIDTCEQGKTSNTACNGNPLVVNGFMMGDHLYFRRTGVVDAFGNATTEQVALIPQLYLNPPKFFDATVDQLLIEGQGEKQPLF